MSIQKYKGRVEVAPGFLLLLGILLYLDDGSGFLWWVCAAALLHELGHLAASAAFGGRVNLISFGIAGIEMKLSYPEILPYNKENIVLLAGAVVNLVTGSIAFKLDIYQMAFISLGLGAFNLLPIIPLDGGQILYNIISGCSDPQLSELIVRIVSASLVGLLIGAGCIIAVSNANVLPLSLGVWLLLGILKKNHTFSSK